MSRIAFFVEGLTEMLFVERLVEEIVDRTNVTIKKNRLLGNSALPMTELVMTQNDSVKHQCLLVDCSGDGGGSRVKNMVVENIESLHRNGYSDVFGLWDVYPNFEYHQLPQVRLGLPKFVPTRYARPHLHIAVMEMETWFLQDRGHFQKFNPLLNEAKISTIFPKPALPNDIELISRPAEKLNEIYQLAGERYLNSQGRKEGATLNRTIKSLDIAWMFLTPSELSNSLELFVRDVAAVLN